MANEIVKCRFKYCNHEHKDLPIEEAVLSGKSTYYHQDCYKQNEEIKQILDIFQKQVNPLVVFSQLRNVVDNIAFKKCLGTEYLLFAIKYAVNNGINLKYPAGLNYIVDYQNIKNAYLKEKVKQQIKNSTQTMQTNSNEVTFTYKPSKVIGFDDIIKG
jgi:hypothetical protein